MGYFMLGTYAILVVIAGLLVVHGFSLLEVLSIFTYPTGLFVFYLCLLWQRSKDLVAQNSIISREILDMIQSVDAPALPFDKVVDTLERELGDTLTCDMRGYMEGTGNE